MLSWLRSRIGRKRSWRASHNESWAGFDQPGPDGVTKFQVETLEALRGDPGVVGVELIRGQKELFYRGSLIGPGVEFFIYGDEAQLGDAIYERWAYASREHLAEAFLIEARKRS